MKVDESLNGGVVSVHMNKVANNHENAFVLHIRHVLYKYI